MSRNLRTAALGALILFAFLMPAAAATLVMRDGRLLEGTVATIGGLAEDPLKMAGKGQEAQVRPIVLVDDNLRRTFVPKSRLAKVQEADASAASEKIVIHQLAAREAGLRVARLGQILKMTEFDQYGRRTLTMMSDRGAIDIVQGITEITPLWTKVEGLTSKLKKVSYILDMRIATTSIPRSTLHKILAQAMDPKWSQDKQRDFRLQLVRLFLQAERFTDAQAELDAIIQDFPSEADLKTQSLELRQLVARRMIDEINLRRKSGQHQLAYALLDKFPSEDVAGETLQQVREFLTEYENTRKQGEQLTEQFSTQVASIKDSTLRARCKLVQDELKTELNINTIDRMADYLRLLDDPQLKAEEKVSLAASGWLLGSNAAATNLAVTLSQYQVRDLVRQYLAEPSKNKRGAIFKQLSSLEGASPKQIAQIIAHMKPPIETEAPEGATTGMYSLQIPGFDKEPDVTYHVQLPPEYDPYRQYPTILALNGGGTSALQELDWWAGGVGDSGSRLGQATRHGYIVVAVDWTNEGQRQYDYSAREHYAVLASLRDACRRFAIDTDRVFLTGHSIGGDAAWDIGLAHPDLWAGVIPVVATVDRYCTRYRQNAKMAPFYVVAGELDGDKTQHNATDLDYYMMHYCDVTVVEYMGRGHEHFSDEIQRIFDWMGRHERDFFPKEFSVSSMRTWDNFFWWVEVAQYPPRCAVEPSDWPPKAGFHALEVKGKISGNNVFVTSGADKITVWLSPELVDFNKPVIVKANGKSLNSGEKRFIEPNLETLLEDVRTRGERLHPFWAKVE